MPSLWDRSKRQRRTPFSDLLADYLDTHRWMRPKHLANETGLSATTIQRYLNGSVTPHDPRILAQISAGTGIPLADLYQAAGIWTPAVLPSALPVEATTLPPPPAQTPARRRPRIAEQQSPYAALNEFLRSVQGWQLDEATRQALIDQFVAAVHAAPPPDVAAWRAQLMERETNHDLIETMEQQAVSPARTVEAANTRQQAQRESSTACEPASISD